ncbi:MAG TPA: Gmad2 immunoglobulin-like domain-containing protein [Acidimicrobiia bacterium]|nr:Gmad2 immunoglobulin-like domain-containing protein [Acidimicrobiia bacterium]
MSGYDDQRMKELADRLVAMSPEPPPFPEEVTVTQPNSAKRSPVLMFAGAAAIVLILAAIPLLLSRGGGEVGPVATTTTSTVPSSSEPSVTSSTQAEATTTTSSETTTTTSAEAQEVIVFLVQSPENSFTSNPAVVPFQTIAVGPEGERAELLALQLLTNDDLVPPPGFETTIPDEVEVLSVDASDNHLMIVEMNEAFVDGAGGLLADFTMLNQLIFTATNFGEIEGVMFTVGGQPVTAFGSEGLDISEFLARDSFLDQLNSVIVDSPASGVADEPLVVSGFANVFEATVSLELVDIDGNVVYEDFTTATCGTGCWGGFSFNIDDFDFGATQVTVRVFWHSPENGEPSDVVSIPVSWGDEDEAAWDFLPGS